MINIMIEICQSINQKIRFQLYLHTRNHTGSKKIKGREKIHQEKRKGHKKKKRYDIEKIRFFAFKTVNNGNHN